MTGVRRERTRLEGDVEGRSVLIAGVGRHMGLAVARAMQASGARVAVSDVREDLTRDAAVALQGEDPHSSGRVLSITADVTSAEDCARAVGAVVHAHGALDILVSCVGRSSFGSVLEMPAELLRAEIETNLVGNFLIAQAAARTMVEAGRGGRIILFSSGAAERARRSGVSHSASKAGVNMLAKVMAIELGEHGITVNAVAPGLVPRTGHVSSEEHRRRVVARLPLGRLGEADDVVGAVMFLASPGASWVTGEVLHVDGGAVAGDASLPASVSTPAITY